MSLRITIIGLISLFLLPIVLTGTTETCDVEFSSPKVIVRYGDPVNVTCSTNHTDYRATGWEVSVGAVKLEGSNSAVWNVSNLTVWDAEPKCFINLKAPPRQCNKPLNLIIYKLPDKVSIDVPERMAANKPYNVTCRVQSVAPRAYVKVKLNKGNEMLDMKMYTSNNTKIPVDLHETFTIYPSVNDHGKNYSCEVELNFTEKILSSHSEPAVISVVDIKKPKLFLANSTEDIEIGELSLVVCSSQDSFPLQEVEMQVFFNGKEVNSTVKAGLLNATYTQKSAAPVNISCTVSVQNFSETSNLIVRGYNLPIPTIGIPDHIPENDNVDITCHVENQQPVNTTQMLKILGEDLVSTDGKAVIHSYTGQREHNGRTVICLTILQLPTQRVTRGSNTTLNVQYLPVFLKALPVKEDFKSGESLASKITCEADGNPKPEIEWLKDNRSIEPDKSLGQGDEGTYVCEAKNALGTATHIVIITVQSPNILLYVLLITFVIAIGLFTSLFYYIYRKKTKTGEYDVKDIKNPSRNGNVAQNDNKEKHPLQPVKV
ncbi:intercellular adhesion molecule 1-like [Erpetoichthys calabaricus]|uniref:Intercellular adhesion molecule 1-like n=1 Tax=Erpetoichthys calabaricus TaxID=27687 RepID=A0A8C4SZV5_ERPCA|nr:intercellular adhesion molecule 1-like [Erpetoichthys calabaricus]